MLYKIYSLMPMIKIKSAVQTILKIRLIIINNFKFKFKEVLTGTQNA